MLNREHEKILAECHANTSNTVRDWMAERQRAVQNGNPWAEEQLKVFIRAYKRLGNGIAAYKYLSGDNEQLELE